MLMAAKSDYFLSMPRVRSGGSAVSSSESVIQRDADCGRARSFRTRNRRGEAESTSRRTLSTAFDRGIEQGIERGIEQGIERGRVQEARNMIPQLGQLIVGPLTDAQRQRLAEIENLDVLEQLVLKISPTSNWDAILNSVGASADLN